MVTAADVFVDVPFVVDDTVVDGASVDEAIVLFAVLEASTIVEVEFEALVLVIASLSVSVSVSSSVPVQVKVAP